MAPIQDLDEGHLLISQNILIASPHPICVKIADFGASKYLKGTELRTKIGTQGYLAPELQGIFVNNKRNDSYTNAVDLWSLGCIVYQILSLKLPFVVYAGSVDVGVAPPLPKANMILLYNFCLGRTMFPDKDLESSGASDHAIAFIKSLLLANPTSRLSALAALQTPWLLEESRSTGGGDSADWYSFLLVQSC